MFKELILTFNPLLYISSSLIDTKSFLLAILVLIIYTVSFNYLSYLFSTALQKVFEASNLITTFQGFNNMILLWFFTFTSNSLQPFFFSDHPKLAGLCSYKLSLYFFIRMLIGMKTNVTNSKTTGL